MTTYEKAYFKVVGLHSATCKPVLNKQLIDKDVIKKIEINYITDSVIVKYDPNLIIKRQIKEKLERSGYKSIRIIH